MAASLAIDARMVQSGIGAYTFNIVRLLRDRLPYPLHLLVNTAYKGRWAPYCQRTSFVNARIYTLREQFAIAAAARQDTVLHVPHYNVPLLYGGKLLVTIHDLTHVLYRRYADSWKSRLYAWPMLAAGVRRAAHIFTVSEYSKRNLIEHLGADSHKITVVHNGIDRVFSPGNKARAKQAIAERFALMRPYLLYVGNLKPHKNVVGLLTAFSRLEKATRQELVLVLAGTDRAGELALRELAARLGITPVFIPDANNEELANLYRAAELLAQPSFEEGFGLTVLEAMACGTPVVCSRAASLPEVGGNACLYFDPEQPDQLKELIELVLHSSEDSARLRKNGFTQAAKFSWEASADTHARVYRRFLI